MGDGSQYGFDPNSLGGSLMKDLLADLKLDDDDWLSLAQLEKELQDMEGDGPRNQSHLSSAPATAASLVVASQPVTTQHPPLPQQVVEPSAALDAWSISLKNFASSSLEKDFLQADSARKEEEKKRQHSRPPPGLPQLEEYDVTSTPSAPPGLVTPPVVSNDELANQLAEKLEQELRSPPMPEAPPPRPSPPPPPPVAAFIPPAALPQHMPPHLPPTAPQVYGVAAAAMPTGYAPPPPHVARAGIATPPPFKTMVPPTPVSTPQTSFGVLPPQHQGQPPPLVMQPGGAPQVPVVRGPAWQTPPPPPPPPQQPRIFANPHPAAPPVPAVGIASRLMPARDICYVVHSILRVILSEEPKEFPEYHVQYWTRHLPAAPSRATPRRSNSNSTTEELASRQARAKVWSTERKVLGATTKQAVTRPRALIAAPAANKTDASSDDRAALWQARICCDQGWQNLLANTPASRIKLFKCLGVTASEGTTSVDEHRLRLVLQLPKGRTLWARTLEQYGLPSAAALPATLRIVWGADSSSSSTIAATDRLWAAWGTVVRQQSFDADRLLEAIRVVMEHATPAFATTSSMTLTHTLLETAQTLAGTNESFRERWKPTEEQFMHLLSGL